MSRRKWTAERGVLWAIELDAPPPRVEPRIAARLTEANASLAPMLAARGAGDDDDQRQRFAAGRRCFVAYAGDDLAAYGWVSQHSEYIGEQEREIKMQSDEAYVWDCATFASYRGQHLYSALLSHINATLFDEKIRRVWIGSALDNRASLRGFANAGFRPVVNVTYRRVLNLRAVWLRARIDAPRELVAAARRVWIAPNDHVWGSLLWSWSSPPTPRRAQIEAPQ